MKKVHYYLMALVAAVLVVMNIAIWQKEQILSDGEVVYVRLAPVDPRSLMQGDYMSLSYAFNNRIPRQSDTKNRVRAIVIKTNDKQVAEFVRLDDGRALAVGEKRLKLSSDGFRPWIKPSSFFFQEGHAPFYEAAEYGLFTFAKDNPDSYLLTGLADKHLQKIQPPSHIDQ